MNKPKSKLNFQGCENMIVLRFLRFWPRFTFSSSYAYPIDFDSLIPNLLLVFGANHRKMRYEFLKPLILWNQYFEFSTGDNPLILQHIHMYLPVNYSTFADEPNGVTDVGLGQQNLLLWIFTVWFYLKVEHFINMFNIAMNLSFFYKFQCAEYE